jgi:hypothetical protein
MHFQIDKTFSRLGHLAEAGSILRSRDQHRTRTSTRRPLPKAAIHLLCITMDDVGHLFVRVAGEEGDIGTVRQLLEHGINLHDPNSAVKWLIMSS